MNIQEFRENAHNMVDWIADYLENIEEYNVMPKINPGDIKKQLPNTPPEKGEDFKSIFSDFENIILPGMTHWQHPNFHAYFPANSSYESLLGEFLTSTLASQCMIWQTSPAAAELEEQTMIWLKQMLGIPEDWDGVIQDTASTASLTALLSAREKKTTYRINKFGYSKLHKFSIYCSSEAHSSIEKAVKIAGFGTDSLRKIPTNPDFSMDIQALRNALVKDLKTGYQPLFLSASLGTTGSTAVDNIEELSEICRKYDIWLHIDAAYAGTALILDEYKEMIKGIQLADSFVFNPHKWMFTNFDCSAYFVKEKEALIKTFEILPEYLKTGKDSQVNNYRDWGIQLGRRFRALKLWFVIRSYGVEGIKEKLRNQISYSEKFEKLLTDHGQFEILAPRKFNLVCFRYKPENIINESELNRINAEILQNINETGKAYISHTKLDGKYTLRIVIAQTYVEEKHIDKFWNLLLESIPK